MTVLIVTNTLDLHADMVITQLRSKDAEFFRLNTDRFPRFGTLGYSDTNEWFIELDSRTLSLFSVESIYWRRPTELTIHPDVVDNDAIAFARAETSEAFRGALYSLNCFWMSYPFRIREASYKVLQLQLASKLGFQVPRWIVTSIPQQAETFIQSCTGNVIVKPLYSGFSRQDDPRTVIYTSVILPEYSPDTVRFAPVLFQEQVAKKRELRITVVGKQIFAAGMDTQSVSAASTDWRAEHDISAIPHHIEKLPNHIGRLCVEMLSKLGLTFGAFDMILTPENNYVFLEINPNGQWGWIEDLTGMPISETIASTLIGNN